MNSRLKRPISHPSEEVTEHRTHRPPGYWSAEAFGVSGRGTREKRGAGAAPYHGGGGREREQGGERWRPPVSPARKAGATATVLLAQEGGATVLPAREAGATGLPAREAGATARPWRPSSSRWSRRSWARTHPSPSAS